MAFQKHLRGNLCSGFCSYPQMAILMMTHKKLFEMRQKPVALTLISLFEGQPLRGSEQCHNVWRILERKLLLNRVQSDLGKENNFSYLLPDEK